jgi:hypothetical protein
MSQNLSGESLIRDYFLGELPENEQDLVQERLLMDGEFLETSLIIEDELMDDYARGVLPPKEQTILEQSLLKNPQQYQKVQLTRTLELLILRADTRTSGHEELSEPTEIKSWGLRHLIEEETIARKYVTTRYQTLIDRKYVAGLSPSENEELDGLKAALDEIDAPYYDSIITRLRRLVEQRGA